jgi:acetoacetyl-CoA synthetase
LKELVLHTDLRREDKLMYITTCGWMMWNWLASGLAVGASLVLYEGSPIYPRIDSLFALIKQAGVTVFGTSAKYLHALEQAAVNIQALPVLRVILSTGSPLASDTFEYVYQNLKNVQLCSISGGTDIISCFALGCPILPVHVGELQCRGLGMAVKVFNEQGEFVVEQQGELVCTQPFVSMPVCFWNDPDNTKYHQAYFSKFKNIWTHGDYAMLTSCSGIMIFGRSDAVLNPGGVRIGTAEIYQVVETLPEIKESLAVGQQIEADERVVLFVVLKPGQVLDKTLEARIKGTIKKQASPRHVPALIIQVNDLPRTVNGKLSELAVKHIINNEPVSNAHALSNPECLAQFKGLLDKS